MTEKERLNSKKPRVTAIQQRAASLREGGVKHAGGFFTFIREQGIVGLAVGLAVGTAAGAAVKQIVDSLINPIVGFLIGGVDLNKLTWVVVEADNNGKGGLELGWGPVLSSLITLTATALVIYWLIHGAKLDRLDKKKA